jgi:hypothetical protein
MKIFEGPAFSGAIDATGSTAVGGAGSLLATHIRDHALIVDGPASVTLKATANDPTGTSVVQSLSFDGGPAAPNAPLDLANNSMIVDYTGATSPVGEVRLLLRAGSQSGHGIISTAATPQRALGYGDNSILNKATFAGQSVDATSVLIKYTYLGDADLDGDADGVDIGTWAVNFTGELGSGPASTMVWTQGDWDYDGDVDGVDAGLWATAFTGELGGAGLAVQIDAPLSRQAAEILQSIGVIVVPEPGGWLGSVTIGVSAFCGRRGRRHLRNSTVTNAANC